VIIIVVYHYVLRFKFGQKKKSQKTIRTSMHLTKRNCKLL